MVLFNYATKELTAKVVYYGPGLCGKTTNLQYIYDTLPEHAKGKMLSLATKTDRTLFFDFLPIDLGKIRGMKTKIQLYTVPGQVFYDTTRKLVLKGADGVVFVADSQAPMLEANIDSFDNLIANLREQNQELKDFPHVVQYNKRDMKNVLPVEKLDRHINRFRTTYFEAVALTGEGVFESLKGISKLVLKNLTQKYGLEMEKDRLLGKKGPATIDLGESESKPAKARSEELTESRTETLGSRKSPGEDRVPSSLSPAPPPISLSGDEEIEFDEFDQEPAVDFLSSNPGGRPAATGFRDLPSESEFGGGAQNGLRGLDDSEVIELDDMAPLEVEELDEMAEIASMASASPHAGEPSKGSGQDGAGPKMRMSPAEVDAIPIPVSITLPTSLAGKPIRLSIDIVFEDI